MENPIKNGWFGGKTHYFRKHPYIPLDLLPLSFPNGFVSQNKSAKDRKISTVLYVRQGSEVKWWVIAQWTSKNSYIIMI